MATIIQTEEPIHEVHIDGLVRKRGFDSYSRQAGTQMIWFSAYNSCVYNSFFAVGREESNLKLQ
jgi:hypothetical protein